MSSVAQVCASEASMRALACAMKKLPWIHLVRLHLVWLPLVWIHLVWLHYGYTYYGPDLRHEELLLVAVGSVDAIPTVARPNVEAVGRRGRAAVPWTWVRGRERGVRGVRGG